MNVKSIVLSLSAVIAVSMCAGAAQLAHPRGWHIAGSNPQGYEYSVDTDQKHGGKSSCCMVGKEAESGEFGTLMQSFRADAYRGKRIRMTAWVKSMDVEEWAGLWVRVDGSEQSAIAFDNMSTRAIKGTADWKQYEIVLDVPEEAAAIAFGVLMAGDGQLWFDDFKFEIVDNTVASTDMGLAPTRTKHRTADFGPEEPKNLDFEKE